MFPFNLFLLNLLLCTIEGQKHSHINSANAPRRELLSTTSTLMNEPVQNNQSVVVGQIIGNGMYISSASELCVTISPSIQISNSAFTVYDFVVSENNLTISEPLNFQNLTLNGLQLCALQNSNGTYFPIIRVANWQTYCDSNDSATIWTTGFIVGLSLTLIALLLILLCLLLFSFNNSAQMTLPGRARKTRHSTSST
jgi:hypothetical protein